MNIKIFYSWQSDTTPKYNQTLIRQALAAAIEKVKREKEDFRFQPILTRLGDSAEPGSGNIVTDINKMIRGCDIFVADLTYITKYSKSDRDPREIRAAINSNVAIELGQAKALIGDKRIIRVMNDAYGSADEDLLPFDIQQDRRPFEYTASNDADIADAQKKLSKFFVAAIKNVLGRLPSLQRERFSPLWTFDTWQQTVDRRIRYITNPDLDQKAETIHQNLKKPCSVLRISGLSGIGKSRFVFESLLSLVSTLEVFPSTILYYDLENREIESGILDTIRQLLQDDESYIFVLDNTTFDSHKRVSSLVLSFSGNSSILTIATDSESETRFVGQTINLEMELETGKEISHKILTNRFGSYPDPLIWNAILTAGGLPAVAASLSYQEELDITGLVNITPSNKVDYILGNDTYIDNCRAVLQVIAAFNKVGYDGEVAGQARLLVEDRDVTPLPMVPEEQRWREFQRIISKYQKKKVIEKRGRYISVQPIWLANELAIEWWEQSSCQIEILNRREFSLLITPLFEKLRYLSRLTSARNFVGSICKKDAFLGRKEILLSDVGATCAEYLAEVDPEAVTECLFRELSSLSIPELFKTTAGRRSLVWTLEKLCRYEDTFKKAAHILLRLAAAENEYIQNNASHQFTQLFLYRYSETSADYNLRIQVLEVGVSYQIPEIDNVIISACSSALYMGPISIVSTNPDIFRSWIRYEPKSNEEIISYWRKMLALLLKYIDRGEDIGKFAAKVVVDRIQGLCEYSILSDILKSINTAIKKELVDYKIVYNQLGDIQYFKTPYEGCSSELEHILEITSPKTFKDKFYSYVLDYETRVDRALFSEEERHQRIELLVPEFIESRGLWQELVTESFGGNPFHTDYFFSQLGLNVANLENEKEEIIGYLLTGLTDNVSDRKFIEPLTSFLKPFDTEYLESVIRRILDDGVYKNNRDYIFDIIGKVPSAYSLLEKMVLEANKGKFRMETILSLTKYADCIKSISDTEFKLLTDTLRGLGAKGIWIALSLLWAANSTHENRELSKIEDELILVPGLFKQNVDSFLEHRGMASILRLIESEVSSHNSIWKQCLSQLFEFIDTFEYRGEFASAIAPFRAIMEKYRESTELILRYLSEIKNDAVFKFFGSSTLFDFSSNTQFQKNGMLFEYCSEETLISWFSKQSCETQLLFTRVLPIFKDKNLDSWHPITERFIDKFNDRTDLLNEIYARMQSYSSAGPMYELLDSQLGVLKKFTDHISIQVRTWASKCTELIEKAIHEEDLLWQER